jgi:hypothetical protein
VSRLRLIRLTVVGEEVPSASVEFGPELTVIYGGSNTGKSYVFEALDFMLGGKSIKAIPESVLYKHVMLTVALPNDEIITLTRKVSGSHFSVYQQDLDHIPERPADFTLNAAHGNNAGGRESLSRYLLELIGLDGKQLRKNQQNVTASLSFRNLCLLTLIDETKVQSPVPPPLSGSYVTRTAELSLLKLFLQGEDDSKFARSIDNAAKRKVSKGKAEILDRAIGELESSIEVSGSLTDLRTRLSLIANAIAEHTDSVDIIVRTRTDLVDEQRDIQRRGIVYRKRLDEVIELIGRFGVLKTKYESDLNRLAMVQEAGTLLGYFRPGVCVFCGAEFEHQSDEQHAMGEITAFGEAIASEIEKTSGLRDDLQITIGDLQSQELRLRESLSRFRAKFDQVGLRIAEEDALLQPERQALEELLSAKKMIDTALNTHEQIVRLINLRASVEPEPEGEPAPPAEVNDLVIAEFSRSISRVVESWAIPNTGAVRYSKDASDVMVDKQVRSSHGQGMRAVLHAAFTAGLAQYCFDRELEHPGFIVIDSPIRPYREPDSGNAESPTEEEITSVTERFYSYFESQFDGQVIVMENEAPPATLSDDTTVVHFTGDRAFGRYGFFPPIPKA